MEDQKLLNRIKSLEDESQNKRMRIDKVMPEDKDGFNGERRIVELDKIIGGQAEKIRYKVMKNNGAWHRTIAGLDVEEDTSSSEVRLIMTIGTKKYKLVFEETE